MALDTISTKPAFTACALEQNITDTYVAQCDPENEYGHVVTAYYDLNDHKYEMTGIKIDDGVSPVYRDREQTKRLLTTEEVLRLEGFETIELCESQGWVW